MSNSYRDRLVRAGATPFEDLWTLLKTDRTAFVEKMQKEHTIHNEKQRINYMATGGNYEYLMMQEVLTEFNRYGGERAPPPPPLAPPHPEAEFWNRMRMPLNPGSAQPALTQTRPREQTVQWVQGNRIIMRPLDREVMPGEPTTKVSIVRK